MTNEEAICLIGSIQFDLTDGYYQREDYIEALCVFDRLNQENTKLKAEIEQYKLFLTTWNNANNELLKYNQELKETNAKLCEEIAELKRFKQYFDELYGTGLEVANWHLNGDLESLDNFMDSANDYMKEKESN